MTITANDRRKSYTGNGAATAFNGPRAFRASHVQVFTGADPSYTLVPPSQYQLQGVGTAGTRIVFNVAPAAGVDILILRTVPLDQPTDITNQGAFLPEIHEDAFDYRVMQLQQLGDSSLQLIVDPDGSGQFVWDAKGSRIINVGDAVLDRDAVNLRTALLLIESVIAGGGGVGVAPKVWSWEGDGESTDFPIAGADVTDPLFYDTAMEADGEPGPFNVLKPGEDFTVIVGSNPDDSAIRFPAPVPAGVKGFTILRGYARPYSGPTPIYTNAMRVVVVGETELLVDGSYQNALIVTTASDPVTLTIRQNTGDADLDWGRADDAEFFCVYQLGDGQVEVVPEDAGTVTPPTDFENKTRAKGCTISCTLLAPDADAWMTAGDLLRVAAAPSLQCFTLEDRSVLIGTNITTGTAKATFVAPYDFILDPIADGGLYAGLAVAQAAGNIFTVDVNVNGTSIVSTKLTIDNAEKTTLTAATPPVYDAAFAAGGRLIAKGQEVTIDVDQVGTALAKGLTVYLVGRRGS